MRKAVDKANALLGAPEGTPAGDTARKTVGGQTAGEVMDRGGDGPRIGEGG